MFAHAMKIAAVEPFILHVPLNRESISDSTHSITHWGVVGVRITADGREATASPAPTRISLPTG